jgi:hypothetical protein
MQIWLVNPFDPCPGGAERLGRYAHLVRALRDAGHGVVWRSGTFSHRFQNDVDQGIARGAGTYDQRWTKPEDRTWMVYSGSLSRTCDFLTVVRAAVLSKQRVSHRVRFPITGQGHLAEKAHRIVRRESHDNVDRCGFLDFEEWAYTVSQADAGFNVSFPDALIYMPNKVFFYMAAALALLNTIPGQCDELIARHDCGVNYEAGDVNAWFEPIRELVEAPGDLRRMKAAPRYLAETAFDRRIIDREFVRFLTDVAGHYCRVQSGEPSRFAREQRPAEFALWE